MPKSSILIPTYRRPERLQRAIRSALAQTHRDLEVRVYDNDSGDETEAVVARLAASDPRLRYHRQEHNLGSFANFKYAIERVDTPYFSILADDDLLLPDFHRLALESFASAPDLVLVGLGCLHSEEGGALLNRPEIGPGRYQPPEGMLEMLRQGHPNWTSVLFRREVGDLIGGLDPAADLYLDFDVLLRAATRASFEIRPELGAVYFYHEGASSSSASGDTGRWSAFAHLAERVTSDESLPPALREEAAVRLRGMFRSMLIKGGMGAARRDNREGAAVAAAALRTQLDDRTAALAIRVVALVARLPGGRPLLRRLADSRRPYTGGRLADGLREAGYPEALNPT